MAAAQSPNAKCSDPIKKKSGGDSVAMTAKGTTADSTQSSASVGWVLGLLYATFIGCRQFFSVTQAAIVEDPSVSGLDTNGCANVVVLAGVGFGISKVFTGLLVDSLDVDARSVTYGFMLVTATLVLVFSFAESYEAMLVLGFLNALPQAGGYPALNKIVFEMLEPHQYSKAIAAISIGSRIGASGSYLILGACLQFMSWRATIRLAPVFVGVSIMVSMLVLGKTGKVQKGPNTHRGGDSKQAKKEEKTEGKKEIVKGDDAEKAAPRSAGQKLLWIASSGQFWKISIASACILVSKGFEAIAPLYISSVLKLSPASSAMLVSAIPAGLVASVFFGSAFLDSMTVRRRGIAIVALCGLNILTSSSLCGVTWYLETGGVPNPTVMVLGCGTLFFTLGFSAGYCFYVPQSLFAIEFGGEDSATVVGCSELIQAVIGASSLKMAGTVSMNLGWRYVWANIVGFGIVATLSMAAYQSQLVLSTENKKRKAA